MFLLDKYQCRLARLFPTSETLRPNCEAEFKWHVEPWHPIFVDLRPGKVVNRAVTLLNYPTELAQASFGSILHLKRTPR